VTRFLLLAAVVGVVAAGTGCAAPENAVRPGQLVPEAPTLVCLGVRWYVSGDANENASVQVSYRRKGEQSWHQALPLFRVGASEENSEERLLRDRGEERGWPFEIGNLFAGSIFDLFPGTAYEVRLALSDPDGGGATEVVTMRTRVVPVAPPPQRTLHVVPGDGGGSGTESDPFRGLEAANAAAKPGDLVLVHAGVYQGTFTVTGSGTPGAPIVWRGAGDGEAVIDGQNGARGVSCNDIQNVFFQDLTIRKADFGMVAHGAKNLTVQRCHFYDNMYSFTACRGSERDLYISDNVIEGRSTWPTKGPQGDEEDRRGIEVGGEGHAVCYNRVSGFGKVYGDGIDINGRGPNRAIDIYNNEISECTDDAIELDTGWTNVRAFRNHITNCFEGISTQPVYGGPAYVFRNAMYSLDYTQFKMHNHSHGMLYFHNTAVKRGIPWVLWTNAEVIRAVSRNNLFIGTEADYAMEFSPQMTKCDFDYDGLGGGPFNAFLKWNGVAYATLADVMAGAPIEHHAVLVDAATVFASGVKAPQIYERQYPLRMNDLRLSATTPAVDAGVVLPNINDGYRGKAPDVGAYEYGSELPHYGPR